MSLGGPTEGRSPADHVDEGLDDWNRYGLSRGDGAADRTPRDALGRPLAESARRDQPSDDLYIQYRRETSQRPTKAARRERSPRFVINVATASIVGMLGVVLLGVALATSPAMPPVSPSPGNSASLVAPATTAPAALTPLAPRAAHVAVLLDLPFEVAVTDRDWPMDDGSTIYLTGPTGGLALDPATGTIRTIYGGPAFAAGVQRAVVDTGLWVSSWPASVKGCGPTCWTGAKTYRIDLATAKVTRTLAATYLLGAADDGIWVATGKQVERLDPSTGAVLSRTPWTRSSEPRIGCGSLWSFAPGSKTSILAQIDPKSGGVIGQSTLDPTVSYGPTYVQTQCWMMSGSAGATIGAAMLVWLNADGTTESTFEYPGKSIVSLDGEFWLYSSDGQMQRLEATSAYSFGVSYTLPVRPPNNDPKWFFAASGMLWLIADNQLIGFDVPTGASRAGG